MNDRYTKIVLTVIAVALTVIAARDWLPVKPATAQNGPVRVIIDSVEPYAFQRTDGSGEGRELLVGRTKNPPGFDEGEVVCKPYPPATGVDRRGR